MPTKSETAARAIGKALRDCRAGQGLSGRDLATRVGLSQQQISRYELGLASVTVQRLFDLAAAMTISPSEIMRIAEGYTRQGLADRDPLSGDLTCIEARFGLAAVEGIRRIENTELRTAVVQFLRELDRSPAADI